jgi:hypothetical protein
MLQDARAWLADRFGRLEMVAAHTEEVLGTAQALIRAELVSIRAARESLNI